MGYPRWIPGLLCTCTPNLCPVYVPKGKCASVPYRRDIPPVLPVYVFKCVPVPVQVPAVPVQTFVPVPDASLGSVRHQYRYRTFR